MKKVLSIIATAIVCAVMLVSCGGPKSNYEKELEAMANAVKAKDYPTVVSNASVILNNIDKATAGDLVTAGLAFSGVVNQKQQDGAAVHSAVPGQDGLRHAGELRAGERRLCYYRRAQAARFLLSDRRQFGGRRGDPGRASFQLHAASREHHQRFGHCTEI